VDIAHSQRLVASLEDSDDCVADLAEPASSVGCHAVCEGMMAACLLPFATRESLEEGGQVLV
jgi:hypothetical protein